MDKAISSCLAQHNLDVAVAWPLAKKLSKSYTIYGSMLLLPGTFLEGPEWEPIPSTQKTSLLEDLYKSLSGHLKVPHIALNKPIPLHLLTGQDETQNENILRAPKNFTPLYGDFGPETSSFPPTQQDFNKAFWVEAKQNGIFQVWAPRWTMFSRGNISEKARLLSLESVFNAVEEGRMGGGSAAVDLFSGIGYFAFSYVKAGIGLVLCWDISGWSCEGLRRGAGRNKWRVRMVGEGEGLDGVGSEEEELRLWVFNETNERAPEQVRALKGQIPPVRHVNLGMLPSSRESLRLAAEILDGGFVGWVHVHENFLVEEIEQKAAETRAEFEKLVREKRGRDVKVEIEYVNRLKNYAPGVMHCVIDIVVRP